MLKYMLAAAFVTVAYIGPAGAVTCTYETCVAACNKLGGRSSGCPSYCEKELKQRRASGVCKTK